MKLKNRKAIEKINKLFETIDKIHKPLVCLFKYRELVQITNIKRGAITTVARDIQEIINKYYEHMNIYALKFDKVDDMGTFLECQKLLKLTQGKISNLLKKLINNNLPKMKAPDPDVFTGKFYQTLKSKMIEILYSLLQKIEARRI